MLKSFADVLDIYNGKNQKQVEDIDGVYPIYGSGGIMGYANDYICPESTVLMGRKGSINKPIYVTSPLWNVDTAFGLVAKKDILNPKYLYYFCEYFDFERLNTTVTIPSLTKANLLKIRIKVPELNVQANIVERLDKVKYIIQKCQEELKLLDNLIKSRFVEMFGKERNRMSMSDLCSIITDGTHQPPKFVEEGIPFVFVANIAGDKLTYETNKFISQETYDELIKRTPIEIGDILLSTVGSYGHPAVVKLDKKFLFQRHIAYLKPKKAIVDSNYLHGALLSPDVQRQIEEDVRGIAQKTLNLSAIKKMTIPVPNINRQKEFADFVTQTTKLKLAG